MARTVLIVDDHGAFRTQARALLEEEGYSVVGEAGDGASALAAALALRPELILLDVQLPDSNGFEVAARLAEQAPEIEVVLTSGRDLGDYRSRLVYSTALGFIAKADLSGESLSALLGTAC